MAPADDSDHSPARAEPTPAEWQLFEHAVAKVQDDIDPDSIVERDVRLTGELSGQPRQVDVLVRGSVGGQPIVIAVECKRYVKRLGIGAVDEFAGKLLDLGVDRGILYALNGLTQPALDRAAGSRVPRIALGDLLVGNEHVEPDLRPLFSGLGDCPNDNCLMGDIRWTWWSASHDRLRAGSCDPCGTWAVECPDCGAVDMLDTGACYTCEARLELVWDRKGIWPEGIDVERADGTSLTYGITNDIAARPRDQEP